MFLLKNHNINDLTFANVDQKLPYAKHKISASGSKTLEEIWYDHAISEQH